MASEATDVNWEVGRLGSERPVFHAPRPSRTMRSAKFFSKRIYCARSSVIEARRGTRLRVSEESAFCASRRIFLADHDHGYMVPDMVPASGFNG